MKQPELSIAKIDRYYSLRAKYDSAVKDYSINPTEINQVHKNTAFGEAMDALYKARDEYMNIQHEIVAETFNT